MAKLSGKRFKLVSKYRVTKTMRDGREFRVLIAVRTDGAILSRTGEGGYKVVGHHPSVESAELHALRVMATNPSYSNFEKVA